MYWCNGPSFEKEKEMVSCEINSQIFILVTRADKRVLDTHYSHSGFVVQIDLRDGFVLFHDVYEGVHPAHLYSVVP